MQCISNGLILTICLLCASIVTLFGQSNAIVEGQLLDESGQPVPFANVVLDPLNLGAVSDQNGHFNLEAVPPGSYRVRVSAIGYETSSYELTILDSRTVRKVFHLSEDVTQLDEVVVEGLGEAAVKKQQGYAVEVLDTRKIQNRNANINQLASQMAGIRVRESGGMGSSFSYSLNGMSGRSVRFFVDGIPMDRYGSAYAINNFPVNLINRMEVYKGVVPPHFGSDALGGVINIVSQSKFSNYLDASYSFGSFNTHRAAVSTRWVEKSSHLFIDFQGFYNYSDNSYKVWGPGVEIADPVTGRAIEIKTNRFHDDYRSASGKIDVGLTDKPWADQVKIGFLYADNYDQLQHGATMASVIGEATRSETSYSPSLYYTKRDFLTPGLDVRLFSSVSWLESHTVDTSSRIYDWEGKIIDDRPTNSEMGAGRNGKSLLTLDTENQFHQANFTYTLGNGHFANLNYTYDGTTREGDDPMNSNRTASFKAPQHLSKQITSLGYEVNMLKEKLNGTIWIKNYDYRVSTVDEEYITDSLGYRPVTYPVEQHTNNFGYGIALKYSYKQHSMFKLSLEKSYRLPDADEVLGDGLFIQTSPDLNPEESINLNIGWLGTNLVLSEKGRLSLEPSFFYRNTYDLILYRVQNNLGSGQFFNIGKVKGIGGSLDVRYQHGNTIELYGNVTYQELRDWNEFNGANRNQTYKDLLPNTPYLLANGGFSVRKQDLIKSGDEIAFYWDLQYVHEFYLNWPSLGDPNTKAVIPTQLINNLGVSMALNSGKYNISVDCTNLFNEQVYDNYLLQKPGRAISLKFRTYISNNN